MYTQADISGNEVADHLSKAGVSEATVYPVPLISSESSPLTSWKTSLIDSLHQVTFGTIGIN